MTIPKYGCCAHNLIFKFMHAMLDSGACIKTIPPGTAIFIVYNHIVIIEQKSYTVKF